MWLWTTYLCSAPKDHHNDEMWLAMEQGISTEVAEDDDVHNKDAHMVKHTHTLSYIVR